jgi:hypothetical protein
MIDKAVDLFALLLAGVKYNLFMILVIRMSSTLDCHNSINNHYIRIK